MKKIWAFIRSFLRRGETEVLDIPIRLVTPNPTNVGQDFFHHFKEDVLKWWREEGRKRVKRKCEILVSEAEVQRERFPDLVVRIREENNFVVVSRLSNHQLMSLGGVEPAARLVAQDTINMLLGQSGKGGKHGGS